MSEIVSYTNRNILLESQIDEQVEALIRANPLQLPAANAPLVTTFKKKLEGNYEIARAKTDTDHAIELLYIAYNTTPQEQGAIRIRIARIMNELIRAQQDSERTIKGAARIAARIGRQLNDQLPDWLDVREEADAAEIRAFVSGDLLELAKGIVDDAATVQFSLGTIVDRYEQILRDVEAVMADSELALSETIEANQRIKKEIVESTAKREQLDKLVSELKQQVDRFEKLASQYGAQADSAEKKAFWASLLKNLTQVLAAVVPLAAIGASGGAGALMGAATVGSLGRQSNGSVDPGKLVEKARLEGLRDSQADIVEALSRKVDELNAQREAATSELERETLDKSLAQARAELEAAKKKLGGLEQQVAGLLRELSDAAADFGEQMKEQAMTLRELERQMLDNVEKYENARREQAAELVRITILLNGQRDEQQSIELAVKSLNLSVAALKRSKEIVEEIAFFFKSFADFMQLIIDDAQERVDDYDRAGSSESLRRNRLNQLIATTDRFFVTQAGQWHAVGAVSAEFAQIFNDGWSKLNKLSGSYITGDELKAYLVQASHQLKVIAEDREAASNQRIASLNDYRAELERRASQG
ncbi:tyrosyl-tRNA deacylase [Pseudomonas sp. RIT623]|uniref:tyrosyl-tRNA deacylase n=1 Tax=Pseudomonas sp. RIT623 TaxID=2559075 RepID=UPI00106F374F|nr:tyrosyl-tRNA deacylase [Pseudomonas sp. RIT623]TFF38615.1 tyrosyl-tRNA deacylase [Pseudomonas sp. RIT623]